jgi:hypothetical protein
MGTATGKVVLGAIAGAILGVIALEFLYKKDPPVALILLFAAMCIGAFIGSVVAVSAGNRAVSMFWLYLALIFGVVTIIPWWHYGMTDEYLPLGTVYVNGRDSSVKLFVFLPHLIISISLASIITLIHKKLAARFPKQAEMRGSDRTEG